MILPVFSHIQLSPVLRARQEGRTVVAASTDLGLTESEATLGPDRVTFADGTILSWDQVDTISGDETACYCVEKNTVRSIRTFCSEQNRAYSLMPTEAAPALLISGVLMHRIKNINPLRAAQAMVDAVAPLRGPVLDTATGLGYTAIASALTASEVITVEADRNVIEMAALNPWSRSLFDNSKITREEGDSFDLITTFAPSTFAAIIHDPPAMRIAGQLYSGEFYRRAWQVLASRGRMFHYIGDPHSKSGSQVTTGVIKRLRDAGFERVIEKPDAFGVVALK